ncbi:unnamed protein product [Pleuronectes platessa]|uniref:Uncharacterized protein n=1 Tax=Pleuronectes platessa TaxID=8262 RepID=A0A9N7Z7Q1_PLEPL|nr:unnamed protein product [Pleuronectes platessa]
MERPNCETSTEKRGDSSADSRPVSALYAGAELQTRRETPHRLLIQAGLDPVESRWPSATGAEIIEMDQARPLPSPAPFLLPHFAVSPPNGVPSISHAPPAVREEQAVMDANHFPCLPVQPRGLSENLSPGFPP